MKLQHFSFLYKTAAMLFPLPLLEKRLAHWLSCWSEITQRGSIDFQQNRGHGTQSVLSYNYRLGHYVTMFCYSFMYDYRELNLFKILYGGELQNSIMQCEYWTQNWAGNLFTGTANVNVAFVSDSLTCNWYPKYWD